MVRRLLGSAIQLFVLTATLAGCGEEQPAISRVEAYALPKTLFAGEWYFNKTVVDVPGTQTVTFEGETDFMATQRVRWDIQEGFLYARKAYEQIQGSKGGDQDSGAYEGEIVGAWRITSHFDIRRGYNPTTGEENNVLTENAEDCKWYNCKYMRVDWSQNLAKDVSFLEFDFRGFKSIKKDPIPFYVQDDTDPRFKPIFDAQAGYIDVTTAISVAPGEINFPYWGVSIPLCFMFSGADASCTTEVVKIRNSFWRRNPNRDYEPRIHRGEKDMWFGYFITERWNYEPDYGLLYKAKQHYLLRHSLWTEHHYADKPCVKDDDCPKDKGSVCDQEIAFHKFDVQTDSDSDGLPDAYEATVPGLNPKTADSNGNGIPDGKDSADGKGGRELNKFYAWDAANMEHRCTKPMVERDPKPVVYFTAGPLPRSLVCDESVGKTEEDQNHGPCEPWKYTSDALSRDQKWSALHHSHIAYDDNFWRIYLRGVWNWSDGDLQKWLKVRDQPLGGSFSAEQQAVLNKFGDDTLGRYAFALCPNNPVQATDPWPCRFPRHSFAQAKTLIDRGLTYNHTLTFEKAKALLDDNKQVDQTPPPIRVGDMRYSYVHYAKDYSAIAPLGYGPNALDVRTGEILSGFANIYSWNDYVATYIKEAVELLNGTMSPTQYIDGVNLDKFLAKVRGQATTTGDNRVVSAADLSAMYKAMEQPWMKQIQKSNSAGNLDKMTDGLGRPLSNRGTLRAMINDVAQSGLFDQSKGGVDVSMIKGTPLEKQLVDNEVLMASGYAPGEVTSLSPEVLDKASLARGGFVERLEARDQFRREIAMNYNVDMMNDMVDEGLMGIAQRLRNLKDVNLWARLRGIITYPVVVHEMGHSFGLMHNFGGSDDAVNYDPKYWDLRTNGKTQNTVCNAAAPKATDLCPFFIKPMTDAQRGVTASADPDLKAGTPGTLSLNEYAYSSVMDYDKWHTMMGLGLGRYDKAALMYGYADKVEVFKDPGNGSTGLPGSKTTINTFEDWWDGDGSVLKLFNDRAQSYHYTLWWVDMQDKLTDENNRQLVPYTQVTKVQDAGGRNLGWFYQNGNQKLVRVPYIYCSHNRSDISDDCMTGDWGADQYERMKMHIDNWDTWYVMNAFPRSRFYASPGGYVSKMYSRFYHRLKNFNNGYAFYQGLFHKWYNDSQIQSFFTDPLSGYGAYTVAMHDAFNTLLRTISMPDIKPFQEKAEIADGQVIYSEATFGTKWATDLTNGRNFATAYYDSSFSGTCGYYWWECLHHIGFYMDKILAIMVLSDPKTYFVGKDTSEDIRQYRVSFFDNYSTQIIDYFGAMLSEDYEAIAPYYDPSKPPDQTVVDANGAKWVNGVAQRNYAVPSKDAVKPPAGAPLEAATRFTLQLYGAVLGMFRFQGNYDNNFVERGRMWKEGKGTQWTITPTDNVIGKSLFLDPFTGATYAGVQYKDGRGIAQRMIAHANALKSRSRFCNKENNTAPDACKTATPALAAEAESKLYDYRQLMDTMLQVTNMYDNYGHNWGNPFSP